MKLSSFPEHTAILCSTELNSYQWSYELVVNTVPDNFLITSNFEGI